MRNEKVGQSQGEKLGNLENAVKSRKMGDLKKETDRLFRKKLAKNGDLEDN